MVVPMLMIGLALLIGFTIGFSVGEIRMEKAARKKPVPKKRTERQVRMAAERKAWLRSQPVGMQPAKTRKEPGVRPAESQINPPRPQPLDKRVMAWSDGSFRYEVHGGYVHKYSRNTNKLLDVYRLNIGGQEPETLMDGFTVLPGSGSEENEV